MQVETMDDPGIVDYRIDLARKAKEGDQVALDRLLESLTPLMEPLINRQLRNKEDRKDAMQMTRLRIIQRLHQLHDVEKLDYWARKVAFTAAMTLGRELSRKPKLWGEFPPPIPDEDDFLGRFIDWECIRMKVAKLPRKLRDTFRLCWLQKLENKEVAERIKMSLKSVTNYKAIILDAVRDCK